MLRSAKSRLIAASVVLIMVATSLVLGLLYWAAYAAIESETQQVVNAELAGLSDDYRRLGALGVGRAIENRLESAQERDAVYLLTDAYGRSIAGNLAGWPPTIAPGSGWVELELYRTDDQRTVMVSAASVRLSSGERLLVGRDSAGRARFDHAILQAIALALVAALGLSAATGWLLSRLVFNRVDDISRTAAEIVSGDLGRRVPLRGGGDEFDRLSSTLNAMLDQIETLIENLRMTTDSIAHDLRSPLTRLRAQVEHLAEPDIDAADRSQAATRALEEADHLIRVFTSLTEISRAEAGIGQSDFSDVELSDLATAAADLYAPVAAEKGVALATKEESACIRGHAPLLSQALSNLIENALRYAPPGSEIEISCRIDGETAILSVGDRGPGVPESDRARVMERFTTLDPSRTERAAGLGLALVSAVTRMHDGELRLRDNRPGLLAEIALPAGGRNSGAPRNRAVEER